MISAGDSIHNAVTGETFTWIKTGRETGGAVAQCDLRLEPTARLAAPHIHAVQEERFDVLEGKVQLVRGKTRGVAEAGETVIVPAGMPHSWAPIEGSALVRVTFTPGNQVEEFFEKFCEWANEGRVNAKGLPPTHLIGPVAVRHELFLTGPPVPLQRALMRMLGRIQDALAR